MMETLLEAAARLRDDGYDVDLAATSDGRLRCGGCGTDRDPEDMVIDEVVRYEGASNPDDQSMLLALRCKCSRRGVYVTRFGPSASAVDGTVLQRLR
jgi:hypothetical protein